MTTFLTQHDIDKKQFVDLISKVSTSIAKTFIDDKAYGGPTPDELKRIIHQTTILPEHGLGFDEVFKMTEEKILPNLLRTSSTDYMAHLHGPSLIETIASELIISTFNQSMDSWDQSPVATEIEVEVINHLCSLYGYDKNADGVFTSGGSQSNQTAIILARDTFCSNNLNYDIKKYGVDEKCRKLRMYTSEISHFSMEKSAHILGLGYQSVVKVPVDSRKKMDINALNQLIQKDIEQGNIPFLIVATVGTTDFGSIDDIKILHEIAQKNQMWLHADAAYGSGVIMSQKYASRVDGLALCDSITVDFHKMFLMPISCSAVLVKNGKNFDALKVWVAFQTRGKDGWSKLIDTCMDNAAYLYEILQKDSDFEVITKPEISSVVFRYCAVQNADDVNKKVRRKLIHEKGIVIGQTVSDSNVCLKFTLLNPLVTHQKLDELISMIKQLAFEVINEK